MQKTSLLFINDSTWIFGVREIGVAVLLKRVFTSLYFSKSLATDPPKMFGERNFKILTPDTLLLRNQSHWEEFCSALLAGVTWFGQNETEANL